MEAVLTSKTTVVVICLDMYYTTMIMYCKCSHEVVTRVEVVTLQCHCITMSQKALTLLLYQETNVDHDSDIFLSNLTMASQNGKIESIEYFSL